MCFIKIHFQFNRNSEFSLTGIFTADPNLDFLGVGTPFEANACFITSPESRALHQRLLSGTLKLRSERQQLAVTSNSDLSHHEMGRQWHYDLPINSEGR
jgi:hypothetical protein